MKPDKTVYRGRRDSDGDTTVTVDNQVLPLERSLKLRNHSPTGFEWGYAGSGPSQLALGILLDFLEDADMALFYYITFKQEHVSGFKPEWQIDGREIRQSIERMQRSDPYVEPQRDYKSRANKAAFPEAQP